MKISREIRIGLFVVLIAAAFIWGYSFLKGRNLIRPVTEYMVIYDKIGGLEESNPVLINGFKVGQVSEIGFLDDLSGRLKVKIWLEKDFPIPLNSVAHIFSADLMGTKAIRIDLSKEKSFHHHTDTLPGTIEGSLQEQVSVQMMPLKMKAENLLLSVDSVMAVLQNIFNEDFRKNFSSSLQDIRATIQNLNSSTNTIDSILIDEKDRIGGIITNIESISTNLKMNNKVLSNILTNVSSITDSLAASEIKSTVLSLNRSLEDLSLVFGQIRQGKGSIGALVYNDSLYNNLEHATRELEFLLRDIRMNPKKYIRMSLIDFGKNQPAENEK